ncbi:MAG TPA: N-acetylmuramic acid 6-phosphate etherase, partial [Candidatus Xenobia bacterium]
GNVTESALPDSLALDALPIGEVLQLMNRQDATVPLSIARVLGSVEAAVEAIVGGFERGGRLIYVGAGTSGRLGVLDAAECPPTFGTPPQQVQAVMAGGMDALLKAVEGAEDDAEEGARQVGLKDVGPHDRVVGISASGRTPFTLGAVREAGRRGAITVGVTCNAGTPLALEAHHPIVLDVGPEVVTGSTRLKAGSAQKMVLNMLSTASLVKSGRVYGNLMVGLLMTNAKLRGRATRMLQQELGIDEGEAEALLMRADGSVPVAFLMGTTGASKERVQATLTEAHDNVRAARQKLTP